MNTRNIIQNKPLILTVDNLLDNAQCQALINKSEHDHKYSQAKLTVGKDQFVTDTEIRNNDRVIFDDVVLADELFELVKPHLPEILHEQWHIKGLNERFRYYRYGKGQTFRPHFDGAFERSANEKSLLTLIFYLNEDYRGGETKFLVYRGFNQPMQTVTYACEPKIGKVLAFEHRQFHEGATVFEGTKYVLRTDVMYHIPQNTKEENNEKNHSLWRRWFQ